MSLNYEETIKLNIIKEAFQTYDKDNDGYITYEEVVSIIRAMSFNPQEKDLNEFIPEKNKKYDFTEYYNVIMKFKKPHSLEDVLEDAKLFDREGTGLISSSDVIHFMSTGNIDEKLPIEELKDIVRVLEKNGKININELIKYMSN